MTSEINQRARVVAVAREWIGTPFHDNQALRGVGVDCAHLLREVAVGAGLIDWFEIEHYSPQFMLHRDDPLFENYVRRFAGEVPESAVGPGDIVLYKVGRSYAHGAIVVDWPTRVIHAFVTYRRVAETHGREQELRTKQVRFYSFWAR